MLFPAVPGGLRLGVLAVEGGEGKDTRRQVGGMGVEAVMSGERSGARGLGGVV